jgi:hypothetical protein
MRDRPDSWPLAGIFRPGRFPATAALLAAATLLGGGCSLFDDVGSGDDDDDDDMMVVRDGGPVGVDGLSRGDACDETRRCRSGLVCRTTCQPSGDRPEGADCQQTGDCDDGLWCTAQRACAPAGDGQDGEECAATGDCSAGLLCVVDLADFGRRCRPAGETDLGFFCSETAECYAGLACLPSPEDGAFRCQEPPETLGMVCAGDGDCDGLLCLPDPTDEAEEPAQLCRSPGQESLDEPPFFPPAWAGADCPEPEAGETVAYFRVPRGEATDEDFYRLPFPNDIRRDDTGRLDLSGHPSPGTVLPIDLVGRYLEAAEDDLDGFGVNPVAFFRFSVPIDRESIRDADDDGRPRLRLVNLDDPEAPDEPPVWLWTRGAVTRYVCDDWVGVRPRHGRPLQPGTTYGVLLERGIATADDLDGPSVPFEPADDFLAMLAAEAPEGDPALADAWTSYAPLRSWLAATGVDPNSLLNAAVFTTQTYRDDVPDLRAAVVAAVPPEPTELTRCDEGVSSPCALGGERACGPAADDFDEIHGRLDLAQFQEGTLPFEDAGGGLARGEDGRPEIVRRDEVCFALTVPRDATAPDAGWPLVVYLHGTGGGIRSAIGSGYAAALAAPGASAGPPAATLTIDLPMHGDRRGGSTKDPKDLFFNFINPEASRDNVLQGTADFFSVMRAVQAWDVAADQSPTGARLRFDKDRVVLFAHSQGATHAALGIPWENELRAAILSGIGGDLVETLRFKRSPIDVAALVPLGLLDASADDGRLRVGDFHPALALFQMVMERVDPVNYAGLYRPPGVDGARHVFMTYGLDDTFTPVESQNAFAQAGAFQVVRRCDETGDCSPLVPIPRVFERDPPVQNNVDYGAAGERTVGLRQYRPPEGVDGHFVAWRNEVGLADTLRFLREALDGRDPPIGAEGGP